MYCPVCKASDIPENSRFCNMCGVDLSEAIKKEQAELERKQMAGLIPITEKSFMAGEQTKKIQVLCRDITKMEEEIDLLTISAYPYSYYPTPRSLIGALYNNLSISVEELAKYPLLDLRKSAGCWISKNIASDGHIRRIGGVEIPRMMYGENDYERRMIKSIKSYMRLLDILTEYDLDTKTVVLPLLGSGDLHLNYNLLLFPMISEVMNLLLRNKIIEKVILVERNYEKARLIAETVDRSYNILAEEEAVTAPGTEPNVFISYTEKGDRIVADMIGSYLKEKGIAYWLAPKDVVCGDYAAEIVKGIKKCTHFICIISKSSMKSPHVLNEIALAHNRINDGIKIIPFLLEDGEMEPAFEYYLIRMNRMQCFPPPIESRIAEWVDNCFDRASDKMGE